jgi:hypothetical protein
MMQRHGIFRVTLGQQAAPSDQPLVTVPAEQSYA